MVKILKSLKLIEDVTITLEEDPQKRISKRQTYNAPSGTEGKIGKDTGIIIEYLSCGHMNNLALQGRTSGVCPKGDI